MDGKKNNMFCSQCGSEIADNAKFCKKCGASISKINSNDTYIKKIEVVTGTKEKEQENRKSVLSVILIILVTVLVIAVAFAVFGMKEVKIRKQLDLGNKYLIELDYEQAIAAYNEVLKIDSKNKDALEGLGEVYQKWTTVLIAEEKYEEVGRIVKDFVEIYGEESEAGQKLLQEIEKQKDRKQQEEQQNNQQDEERAIEEQPKRQEAAEKNTTVTKEVDDNTISNEDICAAITETSLFTWDWFWDSSRDVVDEHNTYIEMVDGYECKYKMVTYEGIYSVEDVIELAKHYYTAAVANEVVNYKEWYEVDGVLYMSEPEDIGGSDPSYYEILIQKDSDIQYTITIYEYWGEALLGSPYDVHYKYVNGYWVFDEILVSSVEVPVYVLEGSESVVIEKVETSDVEGVWFNEGYDTVNNWAFSYQTCFNEDGTVCQTGGRNEDNGTYTISSDGKYITAHYNENYYDFPGDGFQLLEGYEYTVVYEYDKEEKCLYAAYSQEFKDVANSNAEDGRLQRNT